MPSSPAGQLTEKQLKQRSEARRIHGGAAARKALSTGDDFTGPAALAELAVMNELAEARGRASIIERDCVRLQACCDLYWQALSAAAENRDQKKYSSYLKSFGWLASKSLAAWREHRAEQIANGNNGALDYEQVLAAQAESEQSE